MGRSSTVTASEDDIKMAESEFNAAHAILMKCHPGKQGMGADVRYAQTYQRLVILGVRPQLKLKYRGK
jgi:hypothetical protein